jgi:uncharacterized protein
MKSRDYFPLGKAQGDAFCNRETETEWLASNIRACKHSLLVAPRRFGKSSLADKAIAHSGFPVINLNFNVCSDEQDVEALIRQGVSHLIGKALGSVEKIIHLVKNYVHRITPKLSFEAGYANLELTITEQNDNAVANVEEVLTLIEKLLANKKRRAVLLFDEFQTVGLIAKGKGVEAAIRNVAQDMKYLVIVFSGSNRSLLKALFEDENRPLYKLCRKLYLQRIEEHHYQKHLNQASHSTWREKLDAEVFKEIMLLSEQHPYYVNYLCDVLWTNCAALPKVVDVQQAWNRVIEEETSNANAEIAQLSMGQKKVLKYVANHSANTLLSANAAKTIGMALSSIAGAISSLMDKDILDKQNDRYKIINPVIKHLLSEKFISE